MDSPVPLHAALQGSLNIFNCSYLCAPIPLTLSFVPEFLIILLYTLAHCPEICSCALCYGIKQNGQVLIAIAL